MARIAFLLPDMRIGGAERVALTLMHGFIERGHQVDLVVLQAKGELMARLPATVRVIDLNAARLRYALRPLVRYLRRERPEGLQARMWPLTVVGIVARFLARSSTRIVTSDHCNYSAWFRQQPVRLKLIGASMRTLYRAADARVAVSSEVAEDLARISGLERGRFTVIHNPIPHLPDAWGDRAEAEAEACWPGSGRRILTVGALKQQKNQMLLLRAFALVNAREPANLLILGEGELRPELERLARELGVADSVAMPGFRIDPAPFYASANLFVLASDYEGFGNVLIEALAAGTPVVSTDCQSGPREILEDGRYGRLVPVGDAEALATAIDAELGNPADPKLLRQRAWQFRPEVAIDHYLRLLIGEGERG